MRVDEGKTLALLIKSIVIDMPLPISNNSHRESNVTVDSIYYNADYSDFLVHNSYLFKLDESNSRDCDNYENKKSSPLGNLRLPLSENLSHQIT